MCKVGTFFNQVVRSRKHRTSEDCELAWRHEVHPNVNDKRWGAEESRRLKVAKNNNLIFESILKNYMNIL